MSTIDRSDRVFVPRVHGNNKVRLPWASQTTARRTEYANGIPVDPRTGEVDVLRLLELGYDRTEILRLMGEEV